MTPWIIIGLLSVAVIYLLWADWAHRKAWAAQIKHNKKTNTRLGDVETEQTIMQIGRNKSRTVSLRGPRPDA